MRVKCYVVVISLILLALMGNVYAATGQVKGVVSDKGNGSPLPGANVIIKGTSIGAATDLEGRYSIPNAPIGKTTILVSYIGYKPVEVEIDVLPGQIVSKDFVMTFDVMEGAEVIVSAQAEGQMQAINQQLRSNTIVNVVSADRIRELPDANAAESVGRLPGVAVRRSGGEGQRVNIRGLSPKFNAVTVNGERIPATGQGQNVFTIKTGGGGTQSPTVDDRSVDLSFISSEAIGGIQLYKSLTPDRDADAIGGVVDFVTRKPSEGFKTRVNILGGYTGYHESYGNFKGDISLSNRFLDNKLGLMVTGGMHRADRSRDNQEVNYVWLGGATAINSFFLRDVTEQRDRYNANLNLDYQFENSEIIMNNMYAKSFRDVKTRTLKLGIRTNNGDYGASWSKPEIDFYSSNLRGKHMLSFAQVNWGLNYSATIDHNDFNYGYGFNDNTPFQNFNFVEEEGPFAASNVATIDLDAYGGAPWGGGTAKREDKNFSAHFDLKRQFTMGNNVNGYLKLGGKFRNKDRVRNSTGLKGNGGAFLKQYIADHPEAKLALNENNLSMSNFLGAYEPEPFFDGKHPFPISLDAEVPYHMFNDYRSIWRDRVVNGLGDYKAIENIYAGYLMSEFNFFNRITAMGGVRYEHSNNEYEAVYRWDVHEDYDDVSLDQISGAFNDTTSTQDFGKWLPMAHLKFSILQDEYSSNGLDLRMAATKSLTRPDFIKVTPSTSRSNSSFLLERSNPNLMPTEAINYDVFLTGYSSKFGLLTLGSFYKELSHVDFLFAREANVDVDGEDYKGFTIVEPLNSEELTKVWGYEIELQTNFSYLPSPFDGIVLYGNYSRVYSEALYPFNEKKFDPKTFRVTTTLTTRKGTLPGQADHIGNVTLGYDKGRYSGRISYYYQSESLDWLGENEFIDGYIDAYERIDLSSSFRISDMFTAVLNLNNINNRHDKSFVGVNKTVMQNGQEKEHKRMVNSETIYGMQATFGIRVDIDNWWKK